VRPIGDQVSRTPIGLPRRFGDGGQLGQISRGRGGLALFFYRDNLSLFATLANLKLGSLWIHCVGLSPNLLGFYSRYVKYTIPNAIGEQSGNVSQ
jgi:hypothetical protein